MDNESFQDEVLQRLTRIETMIGERDKACALCASGFREDIKELDGKVDENRRDIQGVKVQAATIGGAAGVLAALGLGGGWDFISGLFR